MHVLFYNQNKTIKIVFKTLGLGLTFVSIPPYININIFALDVKLHLFLAIN